MAEVDERKALTRVSQAMRNLITGARTGANQPPDELPAGQLPPPDQPPQAEPPPRTIDQG